MKVFIAIMILLTFNANAKDESKSKEKKFLSVSETMNYYRRGIKLECGKFETVIVTSRFEALKIGKDIMFQPALPINGKFPTAFADTCVVYK